MPTDEMTRGIARANQAILAHLMHNLVDADLVPRDWVMHLLQSVEIDFLEEAAKVGGTVIDAASARSVIETRRIFEKLNPYLAGG